MQRLLGMAGIASLALFALPHSALAGGGGHCPSPLPVVESGKVLVLDNCFAPGNLAVETGATVVWENQSSGLHTITFGSLNGGDLAETFEAKFNRSGSFDYQCLYHPGMTGTVTVSGPEVGDTAIEPLSEIRLSGSSSNPVQVDEPASSAAPAPPVQSVELRIGMAGGLIIAAGLLVIALVSAAASTVAVRRTRH